MRHSSVILRPLCVALLALGLSAAAYRADAAVQLSITPNITSVLINTEFDVTLTIPTTGSTFNGFSVVLSYDPTALTLMPQAPSVLQEGCLMSGGCSAACGNTFHQFVAASDSIVVNDYLFCNQTAITGPGALYKLHFKAGANARATTITVRRVSFYNAGVLVAPVNVSNMTINIASSLAVGDGPGGTHALRVEPNPSFGRMQLVVDDGTTGLTEADILDLQGRVVRHLGPVWLGTRGHLDWDGTDASGARVAGGVYLARTKRGAKTETSRFTVLR